MALSRKKNAIYALGGISFAESIFFPIPPDVLLIPMVLANRQRAWLIAGVCTLTSVLGGLVGYAIGFWLFDTIGQALIEFYSLEEKAVLFQKHYSEWGAWIVGAGGFTPLPYKVITIASGLTQLDLGIFILASLVARGLRFYIVAGLLWRYGHKVQKLIERHLGKLTLLLVAVILAAFLILRLLS